MARHLFRLRWPLGIACLAALACGEDSTPKLTSGTDPATAAPDAGDDAGVSDMRCSHFTVERAPFFGDLHVHTALSLDANVQGTRVRPMDAYRFARGEAISLPPYDAQGNAARTLKLARPLDFAAVTDHAEFLGLVGTCVDKNAPGYDSPNCETFRTQPGISFYTLNVALSAAQGSAGPIAPCDETNAYCGAAARGLWQEAQAAAAASYDQSAACTFTSFVAYEWSASPGTKNLHRNVIFANSTVPALPFSYFDGNEEEALWDALDRDCRKGGKGCDVLTIPHNSNLSAGLMFEPIDRAGSPFSAVYAKRRRSFEPLAELFQHKGSSECLPALGNDEACNFELLPHNTLSSVALALPPDTLTPRDFLRDALGRGLGFEASLGENPFAYGFIGSTDTHVGTPGAVEEAAFAGHGGAGGPPSSAEKTALPDQTELNPGGLAVLWAEENTRESLFAAMRRREAYATSGPRDTLRVFAGYDLPSDLCSRGDLATRGYAGGVPMGGELDARTEAPRMVVSALADPNADPALTGLEALQVVKGTLVDGVPQFKVFDIAGAAPGAGADPETCETGEKGAMSLCGVFQDPEYHPASPAFYYARVLHAPSCRWQALRCRAAGVRCTAGAAVPAGYEACCGSAPDLIRERAWSSPIFVHAEAP
jgi:hypothetical protein